MEKKRFSSGSDDQRSERYLFQAIVIGASAGGLNALSILLSAFDSAFDLPVIIVQHLYPNSVNLMARILDSQCNLTVKEADEKETIKPSIAYLAPANYHLLIEHDRTLSLTIDPKVNFCRPSIDVLFQTAADVYGKDLIGILLTGANSDGARGLAQIKEKGGFTIVQDPTSAEVPIMPQAAIDLFAVDQILPLNQMYKKLKELING